MMNEELSASCLIIGGGLSAYVAAREIISTGKSVVLIAAGSGASPYVHGIQVPTLPQDSASIFLSDTYEGGCRQGKYPLEQILCGESLLVPAMLKELGLCPNRTADGKIELLQPLGASFPRVVSVGNALGAYALARLKTELADRITVIDGRAVKMFRESGAFAALCYADGKPLIIGADKVLIAAGGFGNLYEFSTNGCDTGGDAVAMAHSVGAALVDLEFVQFEPSVAVWPDALRGKSVITTLFFDGAVLRNGRNERFMAERYPQAECVGKDILAREIFWEIAQGRGSEHGGVLLDCTNVAKEKLTKQYRSYYERYLACGIDLSVQPAEIAAGAHTTLGGIETDTACATCVDGLYACGEAAGGIHGANRLGGNAGLETFVFGRRAGQSIAQALLAEKGTSKSDAMRLAQTVSNKTARNIPDIAGLRMRLRRSMTQNLGVVRNAEGIAAIQTEIAEIRERLPDTSEEDIARLQNDLTTADFVARCCAARAGSVGCHIRSDAREEEKRYTLKVKNGMIYREEL